MPTRKFVTKEQVWAELDTLGEDRVRELFTAGQYGGPKHAFAAEWLQRKAEARAERATRRELKLRRRKALAAGGVPKRKRRSRRRFGLAFAVLFVALAIGAALVIGLSR